MNNREGKKNREKKKKKRRRRRRRKTKTKKRMRWRRRRTRKVTDEVTSRRRALKGSGIVIAEDLTKIMPGNATIRDTPKIEF